MTGSFTRGRPRLRSLGAVLLVGMALAASAGCGPSTSERRGEQQSPALEAEWTALQQAGQALQRERAKLAGGTADPQLARRTEILAGQFNRRLIAFLNADPPVQGEPLSERQRAAIRLKSDEDILLARQHIERAGDYLRAIEIYKEALIVDPGYPRLHQELASAQARRYMDRETFQQVKEGMEQEAVRQLLGQPNAHNVREYPEREVVGWFYPKDASGAAAAVWFHQEGGRSTVYLFDFEALQPLREPARGAPLRAPSAT